MAKRPRPGKMQQRHGKTAAVDAVTPDQSSTQSATTSTSIKSNPVDRDDSPPANLDIGATQSLGQAAQRLSGAASKPESFFQEDKGMAQELTGVLRELFSIARRTETQKKPFGPLQELYVQGLDSESIWAELELRNAPLEKHVRKTLKRLLQSEDMSLAADIASDDEEGEEEEADEEESEGGMSGDSDADVALDGDTNAGRNFHGDADGYRDEDGVDAQQAGRTGSSTSRVLGSADGGKKRKKGAGKSIDEDGEAEDMFFDPDDMEKFADEGTMEDDLDDGVLDHMYGGEEGAGPDPEDEEDSDEEDDAEMDEMMDDEDGVREADSDDEAVGVGGGIKHSDFFDDDGMENEMPKRRRTAKAGSDDDVDDDKEGEEDNEGDEDEDENEDEDDEDEDDLTGHGVHLKRMKGKISDQEKELLAEKPWALRGEVHSHDRPQNSLLEATVDVERATRVAPPPTAEMAVSLLDMIKKRCLDGNWDDVMPRDLQGPAVRKEAPHLSQDKSKEGLADLYEKEFLKTTMGVTEDDPQADMKNEMKQLFTKLCGKLDALCNFHYTPKAVIPEMKVQADVAAIAMEEILPSSVADADALAPEEVYAKKRGRNAEFLEGDGEMAQQDRKRARSSKKAVRRKARRQAEATQKLVSKLNPGLGNKYEKAKMLRDIDGAKNVTSVTDTGDSTGREFSTSTKFFTQLQETVRSGVKSAAKGVGADGNEQNTRRAAQLRL